VVDVAVEPDGVAGFVEGAVGGEPVEVVEPCASVGALLATVPVGADLEQPTTTAAAIRVR
jgi:hypothetical protein